MKFRWPMWLLLAITVAVIVVAAAMNAAAVLLACVWVIVGVVGGLVFGLNIRSTSTRSAAWMQRHPAAVFGARLITTSAGLRVIGLIWALIATITGVVLLTSWRG